MSPLAAVLWFWLAVSVSVYGYRIFRRISRGAGATPDGQDASPVDVDDPNRPVGPATALIQNPVAGFERPESVDDDPSTATAPVGGPPLHGSPLDAPPDDARSTPSAPQPSAPPLTPVPPIAPAPVAPDWSAPSSGAAPSTVPASERRAPRQPISDAVAGIRLPCDLAPLVGDATRIDPFDVAFFTTTHDGDNVRGAMAGELVRLGYQVAPTTAFRLSATRADAEVVVTIYPNPATATEGGRPLYPVAVPGAIVVRFQS